MIKAIVILLFFFTNGLTKDAFSYDWDKCRRDMNKKSRTGGLYAGLITTTVIPVQFISSWGACSALGKPEEDRKAFYNDNFDSLKINFSENRGEYMDAFVSFYKCSSEGSKYFSDLVRNNYKDIFGKIYDRYDLDLVYPGNRSVNRAKWNEDWDVTPEVSFDRLQDLINKNKIVKDNCESFI